MLARAQGHNFKFQRDRRLKIEEGVCALKQVDPCGAW